MLFFDDSVQWTHAKYMNVLSYLDACMPMLSSVQCTQDEAWLILLGNSQLSVDTNFHLSAINKQGGGSQQFPHHKIEQNW